MEGLTPQDAELIAKATNTNLPISIHHVQLCHGNIHAALVLGILYIDHINHGESFEKPNAALMLEGMATRAQLRRIHSILRQLDFLTIKTKGIPAKNWYTFNTEKYYQAVLPIIKGIL